MKKIRFMALFMGVLAFWGFGGLLWYQVEDRDVFAILLTAACFLAAVVSFFGVWHGKRWAFVLSRFVAVVALGFGGYFAHFVWTFWLFQTPTLTDRILAVLRPQVSLFLIAPIVWLVLSFLPAVRTKFLPAKKEVRP